MKNAIQLILIVFCVLIFNTGCEKDKEATPEIQVADLVGDWILDSLDFNGITYIPGQNMGQLITAGYDYVMISLLPLTTTELGIYDHTGNSGLSSDVRPYTLSENTIDYGNGAMVFYIENWKTFNGTVLRLKLISSTISISTPINGIYSLTKAL